MAPSSSSSGAFDVRENLTSLVRPTGSRFMAQVDGWRALSILWIMAFHALVYNVDDARSYDLLLRSGPYRLMATGTLAVDLFFVISGFLIGGMLLDERDRTGRIDVGRFYLRRGLRLLPAYYVVIGVMLLLPTRNHGAVWANLLYVNNYVPYERQFMSWAWSLAVEEQFYLVMPLLLLAIPRARLGRFLVAASIAWVGVRGVAVRALDADPAARLHWQVDLNAFAPWWDQLYQPTHTRFGALALGVLAAWAMRDARTTAALSRSRWALLPLTAVLVAVPAWINPFDVPEAVPYPWFLALYRPALCAGVALLLAGGPGGGPMALLGHASLRPIARLSYSAYLVNPIATNILYDLWPCDPEATGLVLVRAVASVAVTLAVAGFLYLTVEKPIMNLRS